MDEQREKLVGYDRLRGIRREGAMRPDPWASNDSLDRLTLIANPKPALRSQPTEAATVALVRDFDRDLSV